MRGGWRPPPLLAGAALLAAAARAQQQVLRLNGACSYLNFLNGLLFKRQPSTTASGAPYYKAISSDYYIYYDPNCMGHSDGSARWIIDSDEPSLTRAEDLDGDGDCVFHALVSSGDLNRPPASATWRMHCDNSWIDRAMTLEDIPQLDHPTTTRTTTTAAPLPTTTTTELPRRLRMEGACDFLSFLNTAVFLQEGSTATGAPYWKAMGHDYYIYFDPDCHGGSNGAQRWIIDNDAPSTTRLQDLDSDGDCMYHAHTDSTDTVRPPVQATWSMFCNHQWTSRQITFFEVTTTTTTTTTTTSTSTTTTSATSTTTSSSTSSSSTTATSTSTSTTSTSTTATSVTATSITATSSSTATRTSTSTQTATTATATTTRTAPASTSLSGSPGTGPALGAVNESEVAVRAACSAFACPSGFALRPNASQLLCAGPACKGQDNATCCEEPHDGTTTITTTMAASTEVPTSPNATAAATTTTVSSTAVPLAQYLRLSGACSEKSMLNGVVFTLQGATASGAPFYKATLDAVDYYLYFDAACSGADQGNPRWILDSDAPIAGHMEDLDGDGQCRYLARLNSQDSSRPPTNSTWRMHCGDSWQDALLGLEATASTTSAAMPPSTTTVPASLTTTAAPHSDILAALLLNGVCEYQSYLNGLVFLKEGNTASGAPFYKAEGEDFYIYWDEHCDGRAESHPRWVVDAQRPNATSLADLDGDADCHYLAQSNSSDRSLPPLDGVWRVYCAGSWQDVHLVLQEAFARVGNGTCEASGKVTIVDAHSCGLAASYLNLSQSAPLSVPDLQGPGGCWWDPVSAQLQLVTTSAHGEDGAGHGSEAHGDQGLEAHSVNGSGHGSDVADHGGEAHSAGGSGHGSDVADHGGEAHGSAPSEHGNESASHGHEASGHASPSDSHAEGHHRRLSESREALCAGGHLAAGGHGHGDVAVAGASGLRSRACAVGLLALGALGLAAAA